MLNVEEALTGKFPNFATQPRIIRNPAISILKRLLYESRINNFLLRNADAYGEDFIERAFDYIDFSYTVSERDRRNIPSIGRVIVIANHPLGSLDGLALLKLIREVRPDVKILANDMLSLFTALESLMIPVDNMTGGSARKSYRKVIQALDNEEAVIIFPAGEVSRAGATGIKDGRWLPGFLHFARKMSAPLLPVHINAKNSILFYGASMLFKPFGTALLAHEIFKQQSQTIRFSIGEMIPAKALTSKSLHDRTVVKRLKKHLYIVGKRQRPIFETETTIAHPENRRLLQDEMISSQLIGETRDGKRIYLMDYRPDSPVIREIGRLREIAFRKAGEGTGMKRDLDKYDQYYRHLVMWDRESLEIAGAYRIGEGRQILDKYGEAGFYTYSLYRYHSEFIRHLANGVELGRSFINPRYWSRNSLDYLWQGLGRYLAINPEIRYLFGPVSMSANYPKVLMDMLAYFYCRYYARAEVLVSPYHPYVLAGETTSGLDNQFNGLNREQAFDYLQQQFKERGHKIPILFKQYAALFEEGGFNALVFSVDPDFGDCMDGLCMADLTRLKENKRKRYIKDKIV